MSATVDELKIKLEAEAKGAQSEIDKLIDKVEKLEKATEGFGKSGGGIAKSVSNMSANFKRNIDDMNTYVDKMASEMSKNLIKAFDIKGDVGKKAVENITRELTMATAKLGKAKAQGADTSSLSANAKDIRAQLIDTIRDLSQVSLTAEKPLQDFVNTIQSISQIAVGNEFFKTHPGNVGVDGSLIGRFTKSNGISLDSLWGQLSSQFPHLLKADTNALDQPNVVNDLFRQLRDTVGTQENKDLLASGAKTEVNEFIKTVTEDMLAMFKTADTRIAELRAEVGDIGKDFAQTGGANLNSPAALQKAIDNAKAQMFKEREKAQLSGVGTKGFDSAISRSIVLENHVASLEEKLERLNMDEADASARRFATTNATIEREIEKMRSEFSGVEEAEAEVEATANTLKLDLMGVANSASVARNEIAQMPSAAEQTTGAVEEVERRTNALTETFNRIGRSIKENLEGGIAKSLGVVVPTEEFARLDSEIDKTILHLNDLKNKMQDSLNANKNFKSTTTYQKYQIEIQRTKAELNGLKQEMDDLGNRTHTIDFGMIGKGISKSFGESITIIKKATSAVGSFVAKLGAPISNAIKNMTKNISKFSIANTGLVKSLARTVKMLRLMVMRMALRGVINQAKESFKELIAFSDKTADSFNKIMNAIHYLGDTLAALVAPVFNASGTFAGMGNIIDALTDKIVDLINKVNQLTSALLGHGTWIKAIKQSKDYASELDKAGKKAKKSLQSFDELNNLMSNDNGNGNGNDGIAGNHFEELPIDPKWKNFADWLADMWDKADFTKLGALLGNKLKDALQKIPWDKIKATARKAGKSLATLLNGFFAVPDLANTIGKTIAEAINTGLEFALSFVQHFDFKQFGKFIGEFISSSLKNIDWSKLKEFAKRLGTGIANAINGLLSTDAIPQIGNAIGAVLRAAVDFAYNLITTIDWKELGVRIREGINAILDQMGEIDATGKSGWEKLGVAISDGLKGVFTALNEVFGDEETRSKVGQAITDFFDGLDIVGIITGARVFIGNLAKGLATVIVSAFKSENFRNGLGEIGDLIVGFLALKLSFDGITKLGKTVGERIGKALLTQLGQVLATDVTAMGALGTLGASLVAFFAGLNIGNKIGKLIFPEDRDLYEGYSGISGTLTLIKDTYVAIFDDITMRFEKWWNYQKETLGKIKDFFVTTMTDMVNAVRNSDLYQAFVDVFNKIKDFVTGIINTAKNWGHDIVENIKEGIKESKIGQAVDGAIQKIRGNSGGGVYANGKWQHIQGFASGGTPLNGEMFLARENGMPELVGRMGSHTAVANNDQIVASVSDGVYRAVVAAMSATQSNTNVNVEIEGDMGKLFRAIRKEGNNYQRRTGNPVFA